MANEPISGFLSEGQKVDLFLSQKEEPYIVTVEAVNEDSVEITAPLMKGYYIPIENGADVELHVGNNKGLYKLPFVITGRNTGTVNTLKLLFKGDVNKIQRRTLLRMHIFVDFELDFPYGLVFKPPMGFQILHGKRGNLSGSGLFFWANKSLPVDFKLNVRLNLEPHFDRPVIAQSRVVRVDKDDLQENFYGIALEFMNIREGDRDKIIAYVLHKERDLIRRGMAG